jgi:hypothetical protein
MVAPKALDKFFGAGNAKDAGGAQTQANSGSGIVDAHGNAYDSRTSGGASGGSAGRAGSSAATSQPSGRRERVRVRDTVEIQRDIDIIEQISQNPAMANSPAARQLYDRQGETNVQKIKNNLVREIDTSITETENNVGATPSSKEGKINGLRGVKNRLTK